MGQRRPDPGIGRRIATRLSLGIPARLISLDGTASVELVDLSLAGAHLILPESRQLAMGVLRWLGFECFADVVWQQDGHAGLKFEKPISGLALRETLLAAPGILDGSYAQRDAEAWARGC